MRAARFHKTGGPEVLAYEEVADPSPKAGEVLVRVEAAGVNFADVMRRRGDDYPEPSPTPFILALAHRLLEGRTPTGKVVLQPWVDA